MSSNNKSYAVYGGVCNSCKGNITLTYYQLTGNASKHKVQRACGCGTSNGDESHRGNKWLTVDANYHSIECICGYTMNADAAHQMSYAPINSTQCKGSCASCGYEIVYTHSFSNNKCIYCGMASGGSIATTISSNSEYFVVRNVESSALTVNLQIWGVSRSESGKSRTLNFTDSVPANTTRVYVKTFMYCGVPDICLFVGYYDVETGASGPLALVANYKSNANDSGTSTNSQISTGTSCTIPTPTTASKSSTEWTAASGTNITYYPVTVNNWIYGAVNNDERDFFYKGVRAGWGVAGFGDSNYGERSGYLENGYVEISYTNNHTCSYVTTYSQTATTHTATSKCSNTRCGNTVVGSAEGHNWNTSHVCTVCQYPGSHSWSAYTVTAAATCTNVGSQSIICAC